MIPTRRARLRRACGRRRLMIPTRCARLRRACGRHRLMIPTRCARLRRACGRHAARRSPTTWRGRGRGRCVWST
ncbi:hypothetical protein BST14_07735 [Mycobacterium arosiense ATCC BAA-1401 = DSM 45069]|uniref:Uncharacterized protein n=1 Tax=Mycobacterium arosiense ATCC BAA-1401 = DSM 45069 TaxID=1265311 RepID=A0A1W9ZKY9_MYCAI|nr:hypothetical protein BST14_07735 [Mycobacterium arosiense ATCC BAA-1401 = DSM 45069]